ncbi:hypothetical protein PO124_15425 [Bacillus licheniformis]|nr:hypothetical protein [Bacillus licheniformis]
MTGENKACSFTKKLAEKSGLTSLKADCKYSSKRNGISHQRFACMGLDGIWN